MKDLVLFLLCLLAYAKIYAQDSASTYIYFNDNTIIKGKALNLRTGFAIKPSIFMDGVFYDAHRVKFFKKHGGFYANINKNIGFLECAELGKLNIYVYTMAGGGGYQTNQYGTGHGGFGGTGSIYKGWFNKGYENEHKLKLKNINKSVADNPEAKKEYTKLKMRHNTAVAGLTIGASMLVIGGLGALASLSDDSYGALGIGLPAGAITMFISLFILPGPRKLQEIATIYNRY
jgi:hypothetical protein